jgi:hypothetical protein
VSHKNGLQLTTADTLFPRGILLVNTRKLGFNDTDCFFHLHSLLKTSILTRLAKRIIDALMSLNFDDQPCSAAAAALFYVLASDVSLSFNLYAVKKRTLLLEFVPVLLVLCTEDLQLSLF